MIDTRAKKELMWLGIAIVGVLILRKVIAKEEPKSNAKGGVQCMCRDKWGNYNINNCPSSKYKDCNQCCSHYGKISDNEKI